MNSAFLQMKEKSMKEIYKSDSIRMAKQIISAADRVKSVGGRIFVFPHKSVDGDCMGAATGVTTMLRVLGAQAYIAMPERLPGNMEFMKLDELVVYPAENPEYSSCQLAFAVDCSEGHRMGINGDIYDNTPDKLIIDHHELDLTADYAWIVPKASSASELVYYVACSLAEVTGKEVSYYVDARAATAMASGIYTDTGRFTYSNTCAETLIAAGELKDLGADIATAGYELFDKKSINEFRISHAADLKAEFYCDNKLAIVTVERAMFEEYNAGPDDISAVVSNLRDIDTVEFACVLRETDDNAVRANLRSQNYFDCCSFAKSYGGGGHIRAAGFTVKDLGINELKEDIIRKASSIL